MALAFSPLAAHRILELITGSGSGSSASRVALHTLPPLAMLLAALILWRRIRPLPGDRKAKSGSHRSLAVAAGLLFGTGAAVANLLTVLASTKASTGNIDAGAAALLLHVAILAPVAEEFAFRGLIYRQMRQSLTPLTGAILSAAIFALMHGAMGQAMWAFALGLVTAFSYEQTRSLLAPILVHALFNAVPVGVAMARTRPEDLGPIWLILCAIALIFTYAARNASREVCQAHPPG